MTPFESLDEMVDTMNAILAECGLVYDDVLGEYVRKSGVADNPHNNKEES